MDTTILRRAPRLTASAILTAALFAGTAVAHASPSSASTSAAAATAQSASVAARNHEVPPHGLPEDWVAKGSGYFRTNDSQDLLRYEVRKNAVPKEVVDFRLQGFNRCLWRKVLVMPDGEGSQWDIVIDPSKGRFSARNGLWAHQVRNGQSLELWKAGFVGFMYKALEISDLGALEPGSS
jgi:hypothetical protein